ncbi:hypothetical protein DAI22_07g218100 [Oryza sativa Japonica Group]|nr:hypothetical protein DAI22_07g218100 [Oryza sativa Japonica Group]KAF2923765.1 hypothetical protein DAI22_07g218100 [Oryza sativa Japonica Group]KAF2923766.1 hypothetical protein DAI22_07g218100 [Oryza sativa Japonica Group]
MARATRICSDRSWLGLRLRKVEFRLGQRWQLRLWELWHHGVFWQFRFRQLRHFGVWQFRQLRQLRHFGVRQFRHLGHLGLWQLRHGGAMRQLRHFGVRRKFRLWQLRHGRVRRQFRLWQLWVLLLQVASCGAHGAAGEQQRHEEEKRGRHGALGNHVVECSTTQRLLSGVALYYLSSV